jgi:excisionase family DNA binding protein
LERCPSDERRGSCDQSPTVVRKVLLRPEEAAYALGIGRTLVYALIGSCEIESVLIGRARRIPVEAVEAYVARLCGEQWPEG